MGKWEEICNISLRTLIISQGRMGNTPGEYKVGDIKCATLFLELVVDTKELIFTFILYTLYIWHIHSFISITHFTFKIFKYLNKNHYKCSTIYNSQAMETAKMPHY
jgi:hypothetical protein